MFRLVLGLSIGYVLGSRAGRERYEQLKLWAERAGDHPAVQGAAGVIGAQLGKLLPKR